MGVLDNKMVLITEAHEEIAQACGQLLKEEGAEVVMVNHQAPETKVKEEEEPGFVFMQRDYHQETEIPKLLEELSPKNGGLRILFTSLNLEKSPRDDAAAEAMPKAVKHLWLLIKHAIPEIARNGGGSIIIYLHPRPTQTTIPLATYLAAQHAALELMRHAAAEAAKMGVRINAIHPGVAQTEIIRDSQESKASSYLISGNLSKVHEVAPEVVARTVLFLAQDENKHVTGSIHSLEEVF